MSKYDSLWKWIKELSGKTIHISNVLEKELQFNAVRRDNHEEKQQ